MKRSGRAAAVLLALVAVACSGSDGGTTPTSPSPGTGASGSGSSGGSGTQTSCLPAAPGNLRVSINNSTRVFTWDAVSNVQDYFIQIADASGGPFLVDTNTTQTTYTWTGASPGSYWARVYARNSCGSGPNSNQLTFN